MVFGAQQNTDWAGQRGAGFRARRVSCYRVSRLLWISASRASTDFGFLELFSGKVAAAPKPDTSSSCHVIHFGHGGRCSGHGVTGILDKFRVINYSFCDAGALIGLF